MYILIEGTDNVGKSSQVQELIKNFPDKIFHKLHYSSLPWGDDLEEHKSYSKTLYTDMFRMMSVLKYNSPLTSLIYDRSHLGESIYSPLYRGYSGDYVFDIEKDWVNILKNDLFLITLINDPATILKRDDGLSFYNDVKEVNREIDLFTEAHNKSNIKNKLLVNVGDRGIKEVGEEIAEFIKNKLL